MSEQLLNNTLEILRYTISAPVTYQQENLFGKNR